MVQKLTIEEMEELAAIRGGNCLSNQYINLRTNLEWQCSEHHVWEAPPDSIRSGSWCPVCAGRPKLTIDDMKDIAKSHGGKCLTKRYVNAHTHLKWRCKKGHEWQATYNNIGKGKWCPRCAHENIASKQRLTIKEMRAIAKSRGGKCISDGYINIDTKIEWECIRRHRFNARPDTVKRGQWCPECKASISENLVRQFFEQLFKQKFSQAWPSWLRNSKGQVMQIDGLCKKLKIGFEYQGQQHYEPAHYLSLAGNIPFEQRQKYDSEKAAICTKTGIRLFCIPFRVMKRGGLEEKIEDLREFIKKAAKELKVILPGRIDSIKIDPVKVYFQDRMTPLLEIVESKGGEIIDGEYAGARAKVKVRCSNGHIWGARPYHLQAGVWCPFCAGNVKSNIQEMKRLAAKRGGKCLSQEYRGNNIKLRWRCKKGHEWETTPGKIKTGTWCPVCAGNRPNSIELFKELAHERNGECMSANYVNMHSKLKWLCERGHEWKATPNSIKRGSWCPYCSGNVKLFLADMKALAMQRGGECLSEDYINNRTKLRWKCKDGHEWEATSAHVRNGTWCPLCARSRKKYLLNE